MSRPPQPAQTISLSFQALCPTQVSAPHPACLSPLLLPAPARGCRLAWPPSFHHCPVEGQTSQAGARPAGVCCRVVGMGRPGLGARRQWGEGASTPCLVSRPLPASLSVPICPACMPGCFPAVLWDPAGSWLLHVFSAGLALLAAGPFGCSS